MSKKVRIILAAALALLLVAVVVALALFSNKDPYTALYQEMTPTEVSEVTTYLQNNGYTDYRVEGSSIMVRNDQYASLLAQLALAGYPKDGSLYGSYWEHAGTLATSSERATALLIATQERLETTIRKFKGVLDADVYITPGEERTYVLEDVSTETTAAVQLSLSSGYTLTDEHADAIRRLVSHAWSGMTIDSVTITDDIGNPYNAGGASASTSADLQWMMEERTANRTRTQVKHVLDQLYGSDNVQVGVGVTVEVNERYIESVTYEQPAGSYESGGLIGRELGYFALTRDGYELVGGVPGTTTNADIPTYVQDTAQGVQNGDGVLSSWEKDNNINETKEQVRVLAPVVTGISIAVTINENANAAANINVADLKTHVAMAANIGGENPEERVSVLIAPFPVETLPEPVAAGLIPPEILPYVIIALAALVLLIVLIVVILSIRRKKKKEQEEEDQRIIEEQLGELGAAGVLSELGIVPPGEEGATPPPTTGADIMNINTERSMELRKAVRQFVQNNPEVASIMLKTWLRGGEDDNG